MHPMLLGCYAPPLPADDPLLVSDLLASPNAEEGQNVDYAAAGTSANDLEFALSELDRHAPFYREAQLYAHGRSPELFFLSEAARRDVVAMIDGFRLNFAGLVVGAIADRMIVNAIDGLSDEVDEALFHVNKFYTWMPEAIYDTLTDGDHYLITLPGEDDDPPVVIPSSAVDTRLFYDSETERIPELGIRRWSVGRGEGRAIRANLWYPDRVERFIREKDAQWRRYENPEAGLSIVDEMPFIPFAHLRTRAPYGRPIHADAYGPQDMIVKAVMTLMAGVEFTGWPQRYALHDEQMVGQTGLPGRAPMAADGSQKPRLKAGPGTVWDVFAKQVGAFPAADLSKLLEVVTFAVKAMSQVTRIPMHYFDPLGAGSSGESRIAADQPVRDSARRQRGNVGRGVAECADQMGDYLSAPGEPEVVWAPDPVISEQTWWETASTRRDLGVPQEQILLEAGYTPDQIEEFKRINALSPTYPATPPTVRPGPDEEINPPKENE